MKTIKEVVSQNLKQARKQAGLTQEYVAHQLKTKQTIYSRYERGKLELDYAKIEQICKILDITPNELFQRD